VQVVSQSVVGPYDAVTVRSSQGEALGDWLRANGYEVPVTIQPTIDAFTNEGFDFIALKLRPGEGVQAMQPVRVVTAGADPSLPLRMVAAGVGPNVGIELFVLSEGRYHLQNFPEATIDFTKLEWDPHNNISNYETLATAALQASGGSAWLTESSGPADLYTMFGFGNTNNPPLAGTYNVTCTPLTRSRLRLTAAPLWSRMRETKRPPPRRPPRRGMRLARRVTTADPLRMAPLRPTTRPPWCPRPPAPRCLRPRCSPTEAPARPRPSLATTCS
jgi:hypothetical protein